MLHPLPNISFRPDRFHRVPQVCWRGLQDDAPTFNAGSPKCAMTALALLRDKELDCEPEVSLDRYESKSILHEKKTTLKSHSQF